MKQRVISLVLILSNMPNFHRFTVIESASEPDFHGSLIFVSSEHPNFDPCSSELLYAFCYVILEQILNTCYTYKLKLSLDLVRGVIQ